MRTARVLTSQPSQCVVALIASNSDAEFPGFKIADNGSSEFQNKIELLSQNLGQGNISKGSLDPDKLAFSNASSDFDVPRAIHYQSDARELAMLLPPLGNTPFDVAS